MAANEGGSIRKLAQALGKGGFVARFSLGFLLRRASTATGATPAPADDDDSAAPEEEFGFSTAILNKDQLLAAAEAVDEEGLGSEESTAMILVPISKRRGNAFPERISVGRTRNCDVVLRYPSISKLHAHLHVNAGRIDRVTDYESANGTWVNGERVPPRGELPVKLGDTIRFGALELQYISADQAYVEAGKP